MKVRARKRRLATGEVSERELWREKRARQVRDRQAVRWPWFVERRAEIVHAVTARGTRAGSSDGLAGRPAVPGKATLCKVRTPALSLRIKAATARQAVRIRLGDPHNTDASRRFCSNRQPCASHRRGALRLQRRAASSRRPASSTVKAPQGRRGIRGRRFRGPNVAPSAVNPANQRASGASQVRRDERLATTSPRPTAPRISPVADFVAQDIGLGEQHVPGAGQQVTENKAPRAFRQRARMAAA